VEHEVGCPGWVRVPNEATALPIVELAGGHQSIPQRLQMLRLLEARRERDRALERLAERCQLLRERLFDRGETEEHREEHGREIHRVGPTVTRCPRRTPGQYWTSSSARWVIPGGNHVPAAITSVGTV